MTTFMIRFRVTPLILKAKQKLNFYRWSSVLP